MNSKGYKWCAVPQCKNTSIKTPNKVFVYVPNKKIIRDKWLKLARRNPNDVVTNSSIYFCEDHFDLPNDMENYMEYHVMGSVLQVRMKPGCMPKTFTCQPDRKTRTSDTTERPYIAKKRKMMILEECEKELKEKSIVSESISEEIALDSSVQQNVEEVPQLIPRVLNECIRAHTRGPYRSVANMTKLPKKPEPNKCRCNSGIKRTRGRKRTSGSDRTNIPNVPDLPTWNTKSEDLRTSESNRTTESPVLTNFSNIPELQTASNSESNHTTSKPDIKYSKVNLDIIASVYNYLQAEYEQLKSSIGTSCDLSPLANILQRTAAATGVSEQAVSAILEEKKREADEELEESDAKRSKLTCESSITEDESTRDASELEQEDDSEQMAEDSEKEGDYMLKMEIKIESENETDTEVKQTKSPASNLCTDDNDIIMKPVQVKIERDMTIDSHCDASSATVSDIKSEPDIP